MRSEPWRRPATIGWVALGGALGTAARYGAVQAFPVTPGWPWAIFVVNLAGSFVLGWLVEAMSRHERTRLLGGVGFCGGLTTYSTFAVEIAGFQRDGRTGLGAAYLAASLAGGLAAAACGLSLGRRHAAWRARS
jgi:CrcB protein